MEFNKCSALEYSLAYCFFMYTVHEGAFMFLCRLREAELEDAAARNQLVAAHAIVCRALQERTAERDSERAQAEHMWYAELSKP